MRLNIYTLATDDNCGTHADVFGSQAERDDALLAWVYSTREARTLRSVFLILCVRTCQTVARLLRHWTPSISGNARHDCRRIKGPPGLEIGAALYRVSP